jgi:hypothetical protein
MGRWPIGSRRWNARLKEEDIPTIRDLWRRGDPVKVIAQAFRVSQGAIYHVLRGHNWKHV